MITQGLLYSRVLLKYKKRQKASDTDIRRRMECAPSLVLARELYTFLIGYYNKSKECLKFAKILLDPLQQFTFKMTGLELTQKIHKKNKATLKIKKPGFSNT